MHAILNLPNILTLLRIAAIPIILYFLSIDQGTPLSFEEQTTFTTFSYGRIATLILIFAGITDLLDGWIARKWNLVSTFGKMIDPLADKLVVTGILMVLVDIQRVPWWLAFLILAREMAASSLRAVASSDGVLIGSIRLGKYKQFLLMVGIGGLMVNGRVLFAHSGGAGMVLLYVALISSWASFVEYVVKYLKAMRGRTKLSNMEEA